MRNEQRVNKLVEGCPACRAWVKIGKKTNTIGNPSENLVCCASRIIMHREIELTGGVLIRRVYHARPSGEVDQEQVDVWIFLSNGVSVPLQVKSSEKGKLTHDRKYGYIPCIVVRSRVVSLGTVVKKFEDIFERIFK